MAFGCTLINSLTFTNTAVYCSGSGLLPLPDVMITEKRKLLFSFCTLFGVCRAWCGGFDTAAEGSNSRAASQDATQTEGTTPYCVYDVASMIRLIMSFCIWFCITLGLELNPINWTQNPRSNQGCSHSSLYTKMLLCNWHAFIMYIIYSSLSCKEHDMLLTHSHNMLQTHTDSQMNKAACRGKADL